MKKLRFITSVLALTWLSLSTVDVQATSKNDLVPCANTTYLSSGMGLICGGDTFTHGTIQVTPAGGVAVLIKNASADPYNLYEVYWLSVGQTLSSAHLLGNFVTDCQGNSIKNSGRPGTALVKPINTAADIAKATFTNIFSSVADKSSGVFLIYSRGPYSYDANVTPPCNPNKLTSYNTSSSPSVEFANPIVIPGVDTDGTKLQFFSGYLH